MGWMWGARLKEDEEEKENNEFQISIKWTDFQRRWLQTGGLDDKSFHLGQ